MAKTTNLDKKRLINEFEMAKSIEVSAAELYEKIAADPEVEDQKIKTAFNTLAGDEQRHAKLVQQIISLIEENL